MATFPLPESAAARFDVARARLAGGDWRSAAELLLDARDRDDWLALGYTNSTEYVRDLGVSPGHASRLVAVARARTVTPGVPLTAAYREALPRPPARSDGAASPL
jgi:hypothetical protein